MSIRKRIISMIFCALMTIGMFGCASGYNTSNDSKEEDTTVYAQIYNEDGLIIAYGEASKVTSSEDKLSYGMIIENTKFSDVPDSLVVFGKLDNPPKVKIFIPNGTFDENGNRIYLVMENDIPTSFAYNAKTDRWNFSFGYRGVSSVRSDWMSWESGRPSLNS